ncbi:MAG TPA: VTT domain-containing protein [Pyrinomonadaceae bacterium]|jgi:uncharacterized membrane protein YdjX (TVP38/TMEM64 family)
MPSTNLRKFVKFARLTLLMLWAAVLIAAIGFYISDPSRFTAANIAAFITAFHTEIWLVYFAMSVLRGFTLLPSTPLVLAGTIVFPSQPVGVLLVSLCGIGLSSSLIYFCSEALGIREYFEDHKPQLVSRIRRRLEQPLGIMFIAAWAFFPLVPTDLVCYVSGSTGVNYWKFILAVLVGEAVLCSLYVFFGGSFINYLRR